MYTVFEINQLRLLNHNSVRPIHPFDQDVVGFNI